MREGEPVRIPAEVLEGLEGLEAVRYHAGTDVLDAAMVRYLAMERGKRTLAVWVQSTKRSMVVVCSIASKLRARYTKSPRPRAWQALKSRVSETLKD